MSKCGDCDNWQCMGNLPRMGYCNKKPKGKNPHSDVPVYERVPIDMDASKCPHFIPAKYLETDSRQSVLDPKARPTADYELIKHDVKVGPETTKDERYWG